MPVSDFKPGSLVLYKTRPAVIAAAADKIDIDLAGGERKRVRPKDIRLLHPGPARLSELGAAVAATDEAWQLLLGEQAAFADFAELLCGEYSPAAAWCAWQILDDGLHFDGDLDGVTSRPAEQVAALRAERDARRQAEADHEAFMSRVAAGTVTAADAPRLAEVERVAYDRSAASRLLQQLGVDNRPEAAHNFLLRCGFWSPRHDPHPQRAEVDLTPPTLAVPPLGAESRRDLTALPAFAIDDSGNEDPDDAIGIEGDRIWVHIADVAALAPPDSALDLDARGRGATLYLADRTVPMLPAAITRTLGLGLDSESPALSLGFRFDGTGVSDVEVAAARVSVERLSYEDAETRLGETGLAQLAEIARAHRALRLARGAVDLSLPEVSIRLRDDIVAIRPLPKLRSRELVTELMLMAGAAAARLLVQRGVAAPFVVQASPEVVARPATLAGIHGLRRTLKPSQSVVQPGLHAGLGLEPYVRVTSPLRRYLDLVTHQQLRALLAQRTVLDADAVALRIQSSAVPAGRVRRAERRSNLHWKLVWLMERPDWQGEAVVVALEERKAVLLIPELALEVRIRRREPMALDDRLPIGVAEIDLAAQLAYFRVLG